MGLWFDVTQAAAGVNVLLLLVLGGIWARNYRRFGSKHALGLSIFAGLMLAENALALYYFTMDPTLSGWFTHMPGAPEMAMMLLRVLTTVALIFLLWVTWD